MTHSNEIASVMRQALEALEKQRTYFLDKNDVAPDNVYEAITSLRVAIASYSQAIARAEGTLEAAVAEQHKPSRSDIKQTSVSEVEPVAWGNFKEDGTLVGLSQHPEDQANWTNKKPLYTHPQPKTKWNKLTVDEINQAIEDNQRFGGFRTVGFAYDIEEILRKKNT